MFLVHLLFFFENLHFLCSDASSWFKDPAVITAVPRLGPVFRTRLHATSNRSDAWFCRQESAAASVSTVEQQCLGLFEELIRGQP